MSRSGHSASGALRSSKPSAARAASECRSDPSRPAPRRSHVCPPLPNRPAPNPYPPARSNAPSEATTRVPRPLSPSRPEAARSRSDARILDVRGGDSRLRRSLATTARDGRSARRFDGSRDRSLTWQARAANGPRDRPGTRRGSARGRPDQRLLDRLPHARAGELRGPEQHDPRRDAEIAGGASTTGTRSSSGKTSH